MMIINVQRGGPSTGLPTKTEQADLLQAIYGRNGECPMPVIAARSPADCFDVAQEAWRIAVRFMTPVMLLTDGYIANGSEPWRIPDAASLPKLEIKHPGPLNERRHVPAVRARRTAGPAVGPARHAGPRAPHRRPGEAGHHRQRQLRSGEPRAHGPHAGAEGGEHGQRLSRRRRSTAPATGELLVLSWGGTYGACATAVHTMQAQGHAVAHCHLRYLNPLPSEPGRDPQALQEGADSRIEPRPAAHADPRQVPGRRHRPEQGPRQAVQRGRGAKPRSKRSSPAIRSTRPSRRRQSRRSPWSAPPTAAAERTGIRNVHFRHTLQIQGKPNS